VNRSTFPLELLAFSHVAMMPWSSDNAPTLTIGPHDYPPDVDLLAIASEIGAAREASRRAFDPLPHPSGHRTRKEHAKLKAFRKRGRKGRGK